MDVTICIPLHPSGHPMLTECIQNVRATAAVDPIVWSDPANVSIARNAAMEAIDTQWICFLDSDAFPLGRTWLQDLVEAAEAAEADIVSPVEIMEFASSERVHPAIPADLRPVEVHPKTCATMCLLVRRSACRNMFDPNCGLTAGYLGPCCEDTDFARRIDDKGGRTIWAPAVQVIHRDRGTYTYKDWLLTDEFLAYEFMSTMLDVKWHQLNRERRSDFFRALGCVPSRDQRTMASGYGPRDLLNAFLPVTDTLRPEDRQPVAGALERILEAFLRRRSM